MSRKTTSILFGAAAAAVAVILLSGVTGHTAAPDRPYRHLGVFTEVLARIKSDYVEEPDLKAVTIGALNGLLESIDPFASYLTAEQAKEIESKSGKLPADVGLVISRRFGYVGVVSALPGSAAAKAGLSTGDMLEAINGISTRDMPLAYAEYLLKGQPNTSIDVTVLRVRKPEPETITLTRAVWPEPALRAELLAQHPNTAYIKVPTLREGRTKEVSAALRKLSAQGARRLVLDLRSCATGKPEEGIALAQLFIPQGLITRLKGQQVPEQKWEALEHPPFPQLPLVVLTNRATAGAAEIAAAALAGSRRAALVGERTYGDAALRKPLRMDDGAVVILSVAKYYSPTGDAIQDKGVTPEHAVAGTDTAMAVEESDEEPETQVAPETAPTPSADKILEKALEVLGESGAVGKAA